MIHGHVAFLRAINVGGHTVKMAELRRMFESLGFHSVATYIASGNVIFRADASEARELEPAIEEHLGKALGYRVATFLRGFPEVTDIAARDPFPRPEFEAGAKLHVAFLREQPGEEVRREILSSRGEVDYFRFQGRELYWLCRGSFRDSAFSGARLERMLGAEITVRNANTVRKIAARYCGAGPTFPR